MAALRLVEARRIAGGSVIGPIDCRARMKSAGVRSV